MAWPYPEHAEEFQRILDGHRSVTILSHVNPDADAIGTSLGIYLWLKAQRKRVEIANADTDIPRNLDFLEGFSKIKSRMDFDDSLIIACDSGSIDRLGFDLDDRTIVNLDHHVTNTQYGTLNIVNPDAVSSSEIAYRIMVKLHPVSAQSATALYAGLVSDTRNFTTGNMRRDVFDLASALLEVGVDVPHVTGQMHHRRSLASLRILGVAIDSLTLLRDARIAIMTIHRADRLKWGAKGSDLDGIVDYARSLVTVDIAIMLVERRHDIKVSLRSKGADVSKIARRFGGGGHRNAAGFEIGGLQLDQVRERIVDAIDKEAIFS